MGGHKMHTLSNIPRSTTNKAFQSMNKDDNSNNHNHITLSLTNNNNHPNRAVYNRSASHTRGSSSNPSN